MLKIQVPMSDTEYFNEDTNRFEVGDVFELTLVHSLVSLSKWESFFEKPFLGKGDKTFEETMWYIKAMTETPDVPPEVYARLTTKNVEDIRSYIDAKMTASTFKAETSKRPNEIITAEIIYYWMISLNIPPEYRFWHLNQLMALIQTINLKNTPPKKRSAAEMAAERRQLNAERMAKYNTKG